MSEMNNKFVFVKSDERESEHIAAPKYSYWRSVFKQFLSKKSTIAILIIASIVIRMGLSQETLPWRKWLNIALCS